MKKIILLLFPAFTVLYLQAQWQPDVRLSATPGSYTSDNNAWCIATRNNQVDVVWVGSLTATDAVLYKKSPDGGISWEEEILLSEMFTFSSSPTIAVDGNKIHTVWSQKVNDYNTEIFYNHSSDGGASWAGPVRLTNSNLDSQRPTLAVEGQNIYIIWEDSRDYPPNGNYLELYFKKSTDGGANWSNDLRLTTPDQEKPGFPSVAVWGETIHLAYSKTPINIGQEIYYMRSDNQGGSWSDPVRLSFNNQAGVGRYPTTAANGDNVFVFWSDTRDDNGYYELYFARSQDGGQTWGNESRLTFAGDDSYGPNVAVSGENLHLTWNEHRDGNWEIYYKNSTDNGLNWSSDTRLTNNAADSWFPSAAVDGQSVNVVWCDNRTGDWNPYFKRNPIGNPVGLEELPDQWEVFPNPTSGKISFGIPKSNAEIQCIEIMDIYGNKRGRVNTPPCLPGKEIEFDISPLADGVYYVRVSIENQMYTKKIIKI